MFAHAKLMLACVGMVRSLGGLSIGESCTLDSQCDNLCCSNDRNATLHGTCTDIPQSARCSYESQLHKVIHLTFWVIFALLAVTCFAGLYCMQTRHQKNINHLIKEFNKEAKPKSDSTPPNEHEYVQMVFDLPRSSIDAQTKEQTDATSKTSTTDFLGTHKR